MTAATTVPCLLPVALGISEGSEPQRPVARVVIGGLTSSTLITPVLIPVVYAALEERPGKVKAARQAGGVSGVSGVGGLQTAKVIERPLTQPATPSSVKCGRHGTLG